MGARLLKIEDNNWQKILLYLKTCDGFKDQVKQDINLACKNFIFLSRKETVTIFLLNFF